MKLRKIEMGPHYSGYGEGAEPGIKCEIELQVGERYTSSVTVKLTPDQTKQVAALAVELAISHLAFDPASIDVEGRPGKPRPQSEPAADLVDAEPL